jgi:hypothetical protein
MASAVLKTLFTGKLKNTSARGCREIPGLKRQQQPSRTWQNIN